MKLNKRNVYMYLYFLFLLKNNNFLITLLVFIIYFNIFNRLIISNMRILITKRGNKFIQEIDNSQRQNVNSSLYSQLGHSIGPVSRNKVSLSYFNRTNHFKKNTRKSILSKTGDQSNKGKSRYNFRNNEYSNESKTSKKFATSVNIEDSLSSKIKNIKRIKVSKRKSFYFPKNFIDKYENTSQTETNSTNLLPTLSNIKSISNSQTNGINSNNEKYLTFNEIIPNKTIHQMKKKILDSNKRKNKDMKITNDNFRTEYTSESDLQKFNKILSYPKISINETNLIKYLNEKTKEPSQIKFLYESNEEKLNKMNKACQMSYINDEKDKIFNVLVRNKLKNKSNDAKKIFQKEINKMENYINEGNKKLEKYNKYKINEREKYYEKFSDFVYDFWSKKNFDRFNKKSTPKSKYTNYDFYYLQEK